MKQDGMVRVTVTLDPIDVDLLDRLAKLEGLNRSAELRSLLGQVRPMIRQTVLAFEAALNGREELSRAAAQVSMSKLQELLPEAERVGDAFLGILARFEGLAAAEGLSPFLDPRLSNHGGHTPTPPPEETAS